MRAVRKVDLIDKIARELQRRYTYSEIDEFLAAVDIDKPNDPSTATNSKWVYSKAALRGASESLLLRLAQELNLDTPAAEISRLLPPKNWEGTNKFKLFISHISKDKNKATRLKECLIPFKINGFVAHEDIYPTLEWQSEIERALHTMDAFIAIHTPGFSASFWTQQEVGFAVGRGVKIISFKMGEDPTGFISKRQALPRRQRSAEEIAKEISALLESDETTAARMLAAKATNNLLVPADDEIPF